MSEKQDAIATEDEVTDIEVTASEEQAGFDASFDNARADEAPATNAEQAQAEASPEQADTESAGEPSQAEAPAANVGFSAEQVTEMLSKLPKIEEVETMTTQELRKVYGKFGEVNQALKELQASMQNSNKPSLNLSEAKFKRLSEEYPELAELLSEDLKEIGVASSPQAQIDPNVIEERVATVKEDLAKQMQHNLLLLQHKDYPKVVASDDFKVWAQTLSEEEQQELNNSWDAMYLGEKLSHFKDWLNKKNSGTNQRRERLERALIPQGKQAAPTPSAMTEEDGFMLAFKR